MFLRLVIGREGYFHSKQTIAISCARLFLSFACGLNLWWQEKKLVAEIKKTAKTGNEVRWLYVLQDIIIFITKSISSWFYFSFLLKTWFMHVKVKNLIPRCHWVMHTPNKICSWFWFKWAIYFCLRWKNVMGLQVFLRFRDSV